MRLSLNWPLRKNLKTKRTMVQTVETTEEEKIAMYLKMPKKKLVEMLRENQKAIERFSSAPAERNIFIPVHPLDHEYLLETAKFCEMSIEDFLCKSTTLGAPQVLVNYLSETPERMVAWVTHAYTKVDFTETFKDFTEKLRGKS